MSDVCTPQIALNCRFEVIERATDDILVILRFDGFLPCFLRVLLSAFRSLHLDAQSVIATMSDKENEVCDTGNDTFSFENAPGCCVSCAAIWHSDEQTCELWERVSEPRDAINLKRAFLVPWVFRTALRLDTALPADLRPLLRCYRLRCACRAFAVSLR